MKLAKVLSLPNVRIILYLGERGEVRYSQLSKLISSRGALSNAFRELDAEKLIQRRIEQTRPIQAFYSLTKRGKELGLELLKMKKMLEN